MGSTLCWSRICKVWIFPFYIYFISKVLVFLEILCNVCFFNSFVTVTFFKLLENVDVAKDKEMKTEILRFLGTVLKEYRTGLGNYFLFVIFMLSLILSDFLVHFWQQRGKFNLQVFYNWIKNTQRVITLLNQV